MPLRQPICAWASCALLAIMMVTASASVAAQAWKPQKPVEIIIGTSPGGPQDRTGRIVQKILQDKKLVSAPINVVNRPGGGGASARHWKAEYGEVKAVLTELDPYAQDSTMRSSRRRCTPAPVLVSVGAGVYFA